MPITDVGDGFPDESIDPTDPGPSLVCVTSNVNTMCCRGITLSLSIEPL